MKTSLLRSGVGIAVCLCGAAIPSQAQSDPPAPKPQGIHGIRSDVPLDIPRDYEHEMQLELAGNLAKEGEQLIAKGKLAEAAEALEKSLAVNESSSPRKRLADVYARLGQLQKAIATYRPQVFQYEEGKPVLDEQGKLISRHTDAQTLFKFALVLLRTGDTAAALEMYHQGTERFGNPGGQRLPLVLPRFDTPDGAALSPLFTEKKLEAMIRLGLAVDDDYNGMSFKERYKERLAEVETALKLWPTSGVLYFYRARITVNDIGAPGPGPLYRAAKVQAKNDLEKAIALGDDKVDAVSQRLLERLNP